MSSSPQRVPCAGVWRFVDTYLDEEFGELERAEFEAHLESCASCTATVREQSAWKQAVRQAAPREKISDVLRARLDGALAAESAAVTQLDQALATAAAAPTAAATASGRGGRSVASAVKHWPYAAAAGIALTMLVTRGKHAPLTADVIAKHQRNLPVEVSGRSDEVRRWYADKVDFPVRPPSFANVRQVAFRGGRLANVQERQAAYLLYEVNGNKVSVFIFDPGELSIESRRHALVGDREVYLDAERGYNVATYRDQGVGYAIASDVDQDQMLKLVSAAVAR